MRNQTAQIVIDVLPGGLCRIRATCGGAPDASYAPLPDARLSPELQKLLVELRERLERSQSAEVGSSVTE